MAFDPDLFAAKWYCSMVNPEEMPNFAADALEAGFDGPALRRLAGLIKPASRDIGKLFDEVLDEIGEVRVRSKEQGIFKLAKTVARAIADGQIDPIQGAQRLSHYAKEAGYPAGLAEFYQLADEPLWGDYARNRDSICADIVAEAKKLIASVPA